MEAGGARTRFKMHCDQCNATAFSTKVPSQAPEVDTLHPVHHSTRMKEKR